MITASPQDTCGGAHRLQVYNLTADAVLGSQFDLSCTNTKYFIKIGEKITKETSMGLKCGFE